MGFSIPLRCNGMAGCFDSVTAESIKTSGAKYANTKATILEYVYLHRTYMDR